MIEQSNLTSAPERRFRNKTTVGLLAALLGCVGAHWWYLGRRHAWLVSAIGVALMIASAFAEIWYENPAFFLLFILILDGFIEAIVLCLISDIRFDGFYNPGLVRQRPSGWGVVLIAIFTLLIVLRLVFSRGPVGYDAWAGIFSAQWMKTLTFTVILALLYHAWVGMRDIWMDYVKPVGLRLALQVFSIVWLVGCAGWAIQVLWRV